MARVLVLLLLSSACSWAAEYLWPLPDSRTLTGGHADSRLDHFHGGVDLRARTPLKVVAPTDGWVERIGINPAGYGRTLYFRLSDGNTAVFGHLSRYEPELQELVRDSQLVRGTYRVDFVFSDSLTAPRYSAGEVLCYTGSSGRGPAHLHFEIRHGAVQLDPLSFYRPQDNDKPVIAAISWVKYSDEIPLSSGRDLVLSASPRVKSSEPVAFLIRCYDPGPWGRNAVPAAIRVYINERQVYEDLPSRIDLLGPANIYEKLVYREFRTNDRDVRRLFDWPEKDAESEIDLPLGWIEDFIGVVRIEVEDRNGNTSSVRIALEAGSERRNLRARDSVETPEFVLTGDDVSLSWAELSPQGQEILINNDDFAFPAKLVLTANQPFEQGKYFFKGSGTTGRIPLWRIPGGADETISCYVLRGGTYGVAVDATPPKLVVSGKSGKLTFTLVDEESSIDDGSVKCRVNGQTAIPEFEYEEDGGLIWTQSSLGRGTHRVQFEAANRAGMSKSWDVEVNIP